MSWLESEFEMLDLGDLRLNRRAVSILDRLGLAPGRTIPQSFQSRGPSRKRKRQYPLTREKSQIVIAKIPLHCLLTYP